LWERDEGGVVSFLFSFRSAHALWRKWPEERVLWQVRSMTGHAGEVFSVAFSPGGKHFVSGSGDMLVKIWDATIGAEVRSFVGVG